MTSSQDSSSFPAEDKCARRGCHNRKTLVSDFCTDCHAAGLAGPDVDCDNLTAFPEAQTAAPKSSPIEFHLPVRPYSPIDARNRMAAALGSTRMASLTAHADYNGHHVTLSWNSYKSYYVAEYFWAERVVLARGSFSDCLKAVVNEYARGALGSSASIVPRNDDTEAIFLALATPGIVEGSLWITQPDGTREISRGTWWTWRHQVASESARDMANPRASKILFDWDLCQASDTRASYEKALMEKYGRMYA